MYVFLIGYVVFQVSIWAWFRGLTWNNVLTALVILGSLASTALPLVDVGTFRTLLVIFVAVTLKVQNLGNTQEIKRLRVMLGDLSAQNDVNMFVQQTPAPSVPSIPPKLPGK